MIWFLTVTGCRAGGLLTLTIEALDLEHLRARVHEKGDKSRYVSLSEECVEVLRQWLVVRPESAATVFCSLHRGSLGKPLGLTGLHYALRQLAKKAKVTEKVGPHRFRHAFGQALALSGVNLKAISTLMGHVNTTTTEEYLRWRQFEDVAEMGRRFNPLNRDEQGR